MRCNAFEMLGEAYFFCCSLCGICRQNVCFGFCLEICFICFGLHLFFSMLFLHISIISRHYITQIFRNIVKSSQNTRGISKNILLTIKLPSGQKAWNDAYVIFSTVCSMDILAIQRDDLSASIQLGTTKTVGVNHFEQVSCWRYSKKEFINCP